MTHALIIDDNMLVSRAMESRLQALGFDSFDRAWGRQQAIRAAEARRPDLIVVGDSMADDAPIEVARRITRSCDVPVLMVTQAGVGLHRNKIDGATTEGPYDLRQLDQALASAGAGPRVNAETVQ